MKKLNLALLIVMIFLLVACEQFPNTDTIIYQSDIVIAPAPTPIDNPNELRVVAVSASTWNTLAILEDGSLWQWGGRRNVREWNDEVGGWVYNEDTLSPTLVMNNIVHASAGESHMLAIDADGNLWTWGSNRLGELGIGERTEGDWRETSHPRPIKIMENVIYAVIAPIVSTSHAGPGRRLYAITSDEVLWGWGDGNDWLIPLGDGSGEEQLAPIRIMENVKSITPTYDGAYATTTDGTEWWWGSRHRSIWVDGQWEHWDDMQLHPILVSERKEPPPTHPPIFAYEIDENGTLWTWGRNLLMRHWNWAPWVGDGTVTDIDMTTGEPTGEDNARHTPVRILENIISVTTVADTAFALDTDGVLWAWGRNHIGQLGDGTTEPRLSPVRIMDNVAYIASDYYIDHGWVSFMNTFVITNDGELWGWGNAERFGSGLLGDGTAEHRLSPVRIIFGEN